MNLLPLISVLYQYSIDNYPYRNTNVNYFSYYPIKRYFYLRQGK